MYTADFKIEYPAGLPVSERRGEIMELMRRNDVIIVCGETGSGKTTQLPKMALELGRGAHGRLIACTQPRRIAAVSVAERVAAETGTAPGQLVGYQHRFAKCAGDKTRIKFMTDGVLLAETRHDRLLNAYDTIIVDEAHERNLNVDFLLGILRRALEKRRDLKVIVSSATLDAERFSKFFWNAPVVTVEGRLFPVTVEYVPPPDGESSDLPRETLAALRRIPIDADTLVFLPGERDIRETADALARSPDHSGDEIIPLMASLPQKELSRAFRTSPRRRIILSTNVAETSLTIPGIRAVVDSGLARIPRYVHRTQVQRLQIERISRASARQRAGRCGRIGPGLCVRLYSEEDFESREEYTPPEILRSSLAGVILTMLDLGLGSMDDFPFIDPPKPAMVAQGYRELLELGAIRREERHAPPAMTKLGRQLCRFPVEPRLARMLIEASRLAALPSTLPIVAAMGCDDPMRRPVDEREKADAAHVQFREPTSDFLGTLKLWKWWDAQSAELSQSKLRRLAEKTYLSFMKMREWRDIKRQLESLAGRLGLDCENDNGGPDAIHRALMTGLLTRIGHLDPEEPVYRGAHGVRFAIHPASALAKKRREPRDERHGRPNAAKPRSRQPAVPEWIMAGELVDTSRLFARSAAIIDPAWIESAASLVCKRSYHSPEWDAESGFVRAVERVTLYGLVIVEGRRRDYTNIDPAEARRLFIVHALVLGDFHHPPRDVAENLAVVEEMRSRAERLRRPEMFDQERLFAHFDKALPADVANVPALRRWLHSASRQERAAFRLNRDEWLSSAGNALAGFPDSIKIGGAVLSLSYRHAPDDTEVDGITCTAKKSDAAILRLWRSDWLVPGALPEKVSFLLNALPNSTRRLVAPIADTVAIIMPLLTPRDESLRDAIRRVVQERCGIRIPPDAFDAVKVPPHLQVMFRITSDDGKQTLAASRSLEEALSAAGVGSSGGAAAGASAAKHVTWDFGRVDPDAADASAGTLNFARFRALRDEGDGVTVRLYNDREAASASHDGGVARLVCLALAGRFKSAAGRKPPLSAALHLKSIGYDPAALARDVFFAAALDAAVRGKDRVRTAEDLAERLQAASWDVVRRHEEILRLAFKIAEEASDISGKLSQLGDETAQDVVTQLAWLVFPGFAKAVAPVRLEHYPRYFKAIRMRIERASHNPSGDETKMARFEPYWEDYREIVSRKDARIASRAALDEYRWMLEEYRVSVFAPEVGTPIRVSPKSLAELWVRATEG